MRKAKMSERVYWNLNNYFFLNAFEELTGMGWQKAYQELSEEKMKEMMNKMSGEERVDMMKKCMESCFSGLSDEEKSKVFEGGFPGMNMGKMPGMNMGTDAWNMMPNMLMSMMSMMCVKMMSDMMGSGAPAGGGPMGMGGPMKMMQRMMGGMFQGEGDNAAKESCSQNSSETGSG